MQLPLKGVLFKKAAIAEALKLLAGPVAAPAETNSLLPGPVPAEASSLLPGAAPPGPAGLRFRPAIQKAGAVHLFPGAVVAEAHNQ